MTRPAIYGHRGGDLGPPNTVEAVRRAASAGADGVEIDVQLGPDGSLIAHHDPVTTSTIFTGEHFEQIVRAVEDAGIELLIDFKSSGPTATEADALAAALSSVAHKHAISVSSFSIPFLTRFGESAPGFPLYPIVSLRQNFPFVRNVDRWAGVSILAAAAAVNPLLPLQVMRARGALLVWFGFTEWPILIKAAKRIGASAVIVKSVGKARNMLGGAS